MNQHERVQMGAMIAGRYRVDRMLGQGGMGIVVQATQLPLHRPVAIKFILPEVLGTPHVVQRFLREAQAAVQLGSEHVARVLDVGTLENGAPYMVLEYLEGADLSSFPRSELTVGGIVDVALQACEALAEAHALGIVHRDIKPANFFLARRADGTPLLKVLDFGISKMPTVNGQLTASQAVIGTPAYMSPEQMRSSRDVDHRSDIWSLGAVLYELLQGAPPFGGDTFSAMVLKVVNDPLPRLTVRVPDGLDEVVYRCLEKDPARRFQSTADLAQALAKYAHTEMQAAISVSRTRGIVGSATPAAAPNVDRARHSQPSTISGSVGESSARNQRTRRWPLITAIGVLAGVVVIALASVTGGHRSATRSPGVQPAGTPANAREPGLDASTPNAQPLAAPPVVASPPAMTTAPAPAPATATTAPTSAPGSATAMPTGPGPNAEHPDEAAATAHETPTTPGLKSPQRPAAPPAPATAPKKSKHPSDVPARPNARPALPRPTAANPILERRK